MLGFMSSKVLGQFDPFHQVPGEDGRLLLVAPNIVHVERELGVDPHDFRLWVCLHEETHRVQFTAVPWLRDHLHGEMRKILGEIEQDPAKMLGDGLKRVGELVRGKAEGSLVDLFSSPEQKQVIDNITGVMSLLEGHADVVMDGVGPEVIPTVDAIRAKFTERRKGLGGLDRLIRRLLGIDAKMAQYRDGAVFVRAASTRSAWTASTPSGPARRTCPARPRSSIRRSGWPASTGEPRGADVSGPDPAVAAVRLAVRRDLPLLAADGGVWSPHVRTGGCVLVACSGGADSLALLSASVFETRRADVRVIGVVVDHGLQDDSAPHTAAVVEQMAGLGVDETASIRVTVDPGPRGIEAGAREARYAALAQLATHFAADAVLLGHTRDDQAETVLLGLARGSGGRSLSGMRSGWNAGDLRFTRPLLDITREQTETACRAEGVAFWTDPHNSDPRFLRSAVRHDVLPVLERELGPGVAAALARTGEMLRADMDALDDLAEELLGEVGREDGIDTAALETAPQALRWRALRLALLEAGAPASDLRRDHVLSVEDIVSGRRPRPRRPAAGQPDGVPRRRPAAVPPDRNTGAAVTLLPRMKALTYDEYGDIDVLHTAEVPEPHAGPGQVRIKVRGASVNPVDFKVMSGAMAGGAPLAASATPGFDAAGVVDEVGDGVTGVSSGDEVFGEGSATHAEFALLDSWAAKPASVGWDVAAAAGMALETAERGLRLLGVQSGETLFVAGGAGGVGSVLVQLAVSRGITVVASAGAGNQDYLREIGATPVEYGDGMVERIQALPGVSIDAVYDVAGQTPDDDLFALAPEPGKVLSIANFGLGEKGGIVTGADPSQGRPVDAFTEGAGLLERGELRIEVQTFPLDDALDAFRTSVGGHVRGKLVLIP